MRPATHRTLSSAAPRPLRPALRRLGALALVGLLAGASSGCALFGRPCMSRQKTGAVTTLTGRVEPGQIVFHTVPYDQQGTQNDVSISWAGQDVAGGPRLHVYAVGTGCEDFEPPADLLPSRGSDPCASSLGNWMGTEVEGEFVQRVIIVPGGPSNGAPDLFEYRLFVVGDAREPVDYTISVTWFRGPDC